jgi:hypothetical protein
MDRRLAVALHDVEPATYERCALIRDWLDDHGVVRATLLVTPAADLHPFDRRSPELADWLAERRAAGDAIAPQGICGQGFGGRGGELLRLDIHPSDLQRRRRVAALEKVLRRAEGRVAVTYDAL